MIVGLAPGRRGGDRTGVPFYGDRSGDRLRIALGASAARVYITNVVKCAPKTCDGAQRVPPSDRAFDGQRGGCILDGRRCRVKNRDPRPDEIRNCAPFLAAELRWVRPRGILALGRVAERAVNEALGRDVAPSAAGVLNGEDPFVAYLPHPASLHFHPRWNRAFDTGLAAILEAAAVTGPR